MERIAVYPGSFDPITYGHLDIIKRALRIFKELWIVILINPRKAPLFSVDERIEMINDLTRNYSNIHIDSYDGLLVDYMRKNNIKVAIRGLRAITDFQYELEMALANKNLCKEFETVFLMTDEKYSFLSSGLVREVASMGGSVSKWVPRSVEQMLAKKFSSHGK